MSTQPSTTHVDKDSTFRDISREAQILPPVPGRPNRRAIALTQANSELSSRAGGRNIAWQKRVAVEVPNLDNVEVSLKAVVVNCRYTFKKIRISN